MTPAEQACTPSRDRQRLYAMTNTTVKAISAPPMAASGMPRPTPFAMSQLENAAQFVMMLLINAPADTRSATIASSVVRSVSTDAFCWPQGGLPSAMSHRPAR